MTLPINLADLKAVSDVLDAVIEMADSLDAEQALEYRHALQGIEKQAKTAAGLMQTQAINTLEGQPRQIGNKILAVKTNGKWRPNHDKIRHHIVSRSLFDPVTGEALEPAAAADRAVRVTYDLFVAPSTPPKQAGLKALKLGNKDVCDWENTGKELVEMLVDEGPQEDDGE